MVSNNSCHVSISSDVTPASYAYMDSLLDNPSQISAVSKNAYSASCFSRRDRLYDTSASIHDQTSVGEKRVFESPTYPANCSVVDLQQAPYIDNFGRSMTSTERRMLTTFRQRSAPPGPRPTTQARSLSPWRTMPNMTPVCKGDLHRFVDVEAIRRQLSDQRLQHDALLQRNVSARCHREAVLRRQKEERSLMRYLHQRRPRSSIHAPLDPLKPPDNTTGYQELAPNSGDSKPAIMIKERMQRRAVEREEGRSSSLCPRMFFSNLPPEMRAMHRAENRQKRNVVVRPADTKVMWKPKHPHQQKKKRSVR